MLGADTGPAIVVLDGPGSRGLARALAPAAATLSAVACPVAFWSGTADTTHPTAMSRRLAERLGGAPVHVVPDAGTFGLLAHYPEALRFAAG